ncbi:hypothetical protein Q4S45_16680 [Massilia sp. R2A-15]|uniref:hypothetical protein n=1 Tax=Massilia sp. R2A-15 TaxID=3064278 RepID=UPI002732B080|nr:hypothetical protein [Massilia sp. R2A-15]WLI88353.1 hypothetical protein Q4S45_16680 [Massilia sp. R2A-15]
MEHLLRPADVTMEAESLPGRDLFVVAKCMVPTDAYLLQGCLAAGGVPAVVADANHVQADLLIAPALGGVRILAPACYLAQAEEIIAAYERGEYALDDNADVGDPI